MSRIARVGYGLSNSPHAYTDAQTGKPTAMPPKPEIALHEYRPTADGGIEHWIDGRLRATVAHENLKEYARIWPDCADLVRELTSSSTSSAAIASSAAAPPSKTPAFLQAGNQGKSQDPGKTGKKKKR